MKRALSGFFREQEGTTSIEYALIATLVGVAIIVALQNFAGVTGVLYEVIAGVTVYL